MRRSREAVRAVSGAEIVPDPRRVRGFLIRVGGTDQSYVDLDDPLYLEFDYMQRIADVLDAALPAPHPLRAVHVGGAGLTLPRYLAASRPVSRHTVFEPDEALTAAVRRYLPLPPRARIKVRPVRGEVGVASLASGFADTLVVDAFVGGRVPAEVTTAEFFAEAARVLGPAGVLVVNLTDRGPLGYVRRVIAGVLAAFDEALVCAEPATFKGRRFGNVVVAAGRTPLPYAEIVTRAGRGPFPYRVVHGARLHALLSGVAAFHDPGEWSPEPPAGLFGLG